MSNSLSVDIITKREDINYKKCFVYKNCIEEVKLCVCGNKLWYIVTVTKICGFKINRWSIEYARNI